MSVLLTPSCPELRLLVSLAAWTWHGTRPDSREIAHILITHTPALTGSGTAETTEARSQTRSSVIPLPASACFPASGETNDEGRRPTR
ncbi:hypothetical protein ACWEKM_19670 [Streptomyces sp. NPDC004752]